MEELDKKQLKELDNFNVDGRFNSKGNQTYKVSRFWERHKEIVRRILLGQGNKEVALALHITTQTVSNVRNAPIVQQKLAILCAARDAESVDVSKILLEEAPKSLQILVDIRDGKMDSTTNQIMKAATEILNRTPQTAPVSRQQTQSINMNVTPSDLEDIKKRSQEAKQKSREFQEEQRMAEAEPVKEEKVA